MQIVEVKNNLVKASYNPNQENLILSGFVAIKASMQSFIGQVISVDANSKGNFAIIKLLFTFDSQGVITSYNGAVPEVNSIMDIVPSQELLELLPIEDPILLGDLAQQNMKLKLDRSLLENKLLICCENQEDNDTLVSNLALQMAEKGKKVLLIDLHGNLDLSSNKIVAGKDFRLPLNYDSINFIYEKGLEDASAETKAVIQEVFLEVQNYVKTLAEKFIPFETFKNVVDAQYQESELVELVLLKNKLLKYYEEGIFAQKKSEFVSLRQALIKENITIFDLSSTNDIFQRQMISYAYSLISKMIEQSQEEIYVFVSINDSNSDKKLLKQMLMAKKVYSVLSCPYAYKYLNELKQLSKNLIFFTPIQQQNDFPIYNAFLNKLNRNEFIIYGQITHNMPLIVKLDKYIPFSTEEKPASVNIEVQPQVSQQDILDEEIKRDVDEIFMAPKREEFSLEDIEQEPQIVQEDELTEEDLDFIDDLNSINQEETDIIVHKEPTEEYIEEQITENIEQIQELPEEIFEEEEKFSVEEAEESFSEAPSETFSDVLSQQKDEKPRQMPPVIDILPANMSSTPIVPIYSADIEPQVQSDNIEQGDIITHPKYGKGTVEKMISYGSKTLCSINFDNVGRRLLDPNLAELKKVDE